MEKLKNHLFPFFWQHGENAETLSEYMDKIAGSGMRGVCVEARPHPDFVGEGWWRDMDLILKKAKQSGMKLWILDDSHFPTGFANGKIRDCYPQYKKIYLDMRRFDVQGPMNGARADFKMLKGRPWENPDPSEQILGVYLAKRQTEGNPEGDPIFAATLSDISAQMDMKKRLLTLDIPQGAYSIFVVYVTGNRGEESTKEYLNPLVREAAQVLVDEVYEPHYAHYGEEFGKTIQGFFSDEPRFGNVKGTEGRIGHADMVLPWREGLEKEMHFASEYLPLLWIDSVEQKERNIRFQYMDLVTRLYQENFTKVLGDWCRAHGVWYLGHTIEDNGAHARLGYGTGHFFRGQQDMDFSGIDVIGGQIVPGMSYHHDAFNSGGSNGEFYHYALAKLGSSAAHLDPRKQGRTMCEAFGAYGWNEGLKMMKWIADHLLVRGVNYLVPHAFDPKEFPDFDCPPHFYAHGHNPQFRYFRVFSDYVNRMAEIISGGSHPAKVGVLYPAEQEWVGDYMPVEKPAKELTLCQISFDIVSRDYLLGAESGKGTYVINGQTLEVLVVPYGEALPYDIAGKILALAKCGVKVFVLEQLPECLVGTAKAAAAGRELLEELRGYMKVISLEELGAELETYCMAKTGEHCPDLAVGEYEKDGIRRYLFFNEHIGETIKTTVEIRTGGNGWRYDCFTGGNYPLKPMGENRYLLELEPYESAVWMFAAKDCGRDRKICAGSQPEKKESWTELVLPEEWTVTYADSFSYPEFKEALPLRQLSCVQTVEGWEERSGTVAYEATVRLEQEGQVRLDLGTVYETAEVFVNGVSAGCRICRPYRFDIGDLLKQGENTLRIEVTNTLGTQMRDAISHYLVIEPFGVEGPVKLEIQ